MKEMYDMYKCTNQKGLTQFDQKITVMECGDQQLSAMTLAIVLKIKVYIDALMHFILLYKQ